MIDGTILVSFHSNNKTMEENKNGGQERSQMTENDHRQEQPSSGENRGRTEQVSDQQGLREDPGAKDDMLYRNNPEKETGHYAGSHRRTKE